MVEKFGWEGRQPMNNILIICAFLGITQIEKIIPLCLHSAVHNQDSGPQNRQFGKHNNRDLTQRQLVNPSKVIIDLLDGERIRFVPKIAAAPDWNAHLFKLQQAGTVFLSLGSGKPRLCYWHFSLQFEVEKSYITSMTSITHLEIVVFSWLQSGQPVWADCKHGKS